MITTILSFIFVISVLVFFHELGHFLAAKSVGIRVEKFYVGINLFGLGIKKKINNNLMLGVYEAKKGRVIYMADNPLFRSYWYNSKVLFGNAVFLVKE